LAGTLGAALAAALAAPLAAPLAAALAAPLAAALAVAFALAAADAAALLMGAVLDAPRVKLGTLAEAMGAPVDTLGGVPFSEHAATASTRQNALTRMNWRYRSLLLGANIGASSGDATQPRARGVRQPAPGA